MRATEPDLLSNDAPKEQKADPVVVVAFNPWRYEKEEHLLVPLLKTMELAVEQYIRENQADVTKQDWIDSLEALAGFASLSGLAFMQAFKAKYTNKALGIDVDFDLEKFLKGIQAGKPPKKPPESALGKLASYYFELEQRLQEQTSGANAVHLLFLIDDLDRCLPEKAVEMLESIKLFLDVAGCAFVLALDDEVVERGIVHRYRDYIFQHNGQPQDNKTLAQLPITGPEYLEKSSTCRFACRNPRRTTFVNFCVQVN